MRRVDGSGDARLPHDAKRLLRIGNVKRDVDEELRFHFERTVDDLVNEGWTPEDAQREASRRFGDESAYRRHLQAIDGEIVRAKSFRTTIDTLRTMLVQAVRGMVRSPGLTIGIVLAFALGIGANATMYGIIDRLLLRPPSSIANPDRVSHLYFESYSTFFGKRFAEGVISYPDFADLHFAKSFSDIAAVSASTITVGKGEDAAEVKASLVSDNFFRLLGTPVLLGRYFVPGTDGLSGPHEAVLSYDYWRKMYGGARDVIGRTLDFGYGDYTIVGVTPRGFTGVDLAAVDVFLPIEATASQTQGTAWKPDPDGRSWQWIDVYARLAPGVSVARATAEATAIHAAARASDVARGDWGAAPSVIVGSLIAARGPNATSAIVVAELLAGVSLLVLIIACVNVANLLLARMIRQNREIAVRLALGISRRRLISQMILEGVLLSLLGAAAATGVASWGGGIVRTRLMPEVAWDNPETDHRVLIAIIVIGVVAGLFASIVPASQYLKRNLSDMIRQATAGGMTRSTARVRGALALCQTALSVLLLVGAGLFVRSLNNVRHLDLGFNPSNLMYAVPRVSAATPIDRPTMGALYQRGAESFRSIPGVVDVAYSSTMPFRQYRSLHVRAEGIDSIVTPPGATMKLHGVSPNYFQTMQLTVLRGRVITASDVQGAAPVVVINKSMAQFLWPDKDPIGKCLYIGKSDESGRPCSRVIGVVEDASNRNLREEALAMQYYIALDQTQEYAGPSFWFIRLRREQPAAVRALQKQILSLDPRIRFAQVGSFDEQLEPERQSWELGATMFGIFGALALIVAAIGLYSVLSFDVTQRTREFGLRAALGATRTQLLRMTVTRALRLTAGGIGIGGGAALLAAPRIQAMLFDTSPRDPVTFAAVAGALIIVALAASAIPGWRSTRADPNVALRSDG